MLDMLKTDNAGFKETFSFFKNEMKLVEEALVKNFQSDIALIPDISRYLTENGGKRIRPFLLLAASRLCGYNNGNRHVTYSCVIEFIHVATLLHDDVIDAAAIRRGKQTANLKWGNKASVLVADYLLAKSFLLMSEDNNSKIMNFMSQTTKDIVEGETLQLMNNCKLNTTEQEYLDIINRKTAVLFSASCRIGAVLGGTSEEHELALRRFGESIGLAFQLVDDLLDYFADESRLGKKVGMDLMEGNITLPLIHLYQNAIHTDKKRIEAIVKSENITNDSFNEILELMKNYKSREYTLNKAKKYIEECKTYLEIFNDSKLINAIHSVADYVVQRDM